MAALGKFRPTPTNFIYSSENCPSTSNPANITIDCDQLGQLGIYNFPTPFAIKRVSFVLKRRVRAPIAAAVGCDLALSPHHTQPCYATEQSGHFSPFIIGKGSFGFQEVVFPSPVSRLSSGGRFGNVQFWLVDLTTRNFLTDYLDEASTTYVHLETGRVSFQQPQQSTLYSTANCILSSSSWQQATLSYNNNNTPSQFTCPLVDDSLLEERELDWSMSLKWCSIPNRFNTLTSDETYSITVKKILLPPGEEPDESADPDQLDGGEVTVYIQPGCYLTVESLAEAITKSFRDSDLPLKCSAVTKVVELRGDSYRVFPVLKNSTLVAEMTEILHLWFINWLGDSAGSPLDPSPYDDCEAAVEYVRDAIATRELSNQIEVSVERVGNYYALVDTTPFDSRRVQYYLDMSPALAKICGFSTGDDMMAVSEGPVWSEEEGVDLAATYPQQFLLCSDVLRPSYILGGNDAIATQPFLYHFTVPDPSKHALITPGHGFGQPVGVAHPRFSELRFTMRSLDGRQLEIESQSPSRAENTTWLHVYMSSTAHRSARRRQGAQ